MDKKLIKAIFDKVVSRHKRYFKKLPKCGCDDDYLGAEFEMIHKYQRCENLDKFEEIMEKFATDLEKALKKENIFVEGWSIGACDISCTLLTMKG